VCTEQTGASLPACRAVEAARQAAAQEDLALHTAEGLMPAKSGGVARSAGSAMMSRRGSLFVGTPKVSRGRDRGLPPPLHSSVRQVPVLFKPQCMLSRNLGYPLKPSVQMPLGQQNFSVH
jgi:hypothetical protein